MSTAPAGGQLDKITGHSHKIVIEPIGADRRIPTIVVHAADGGVGALRGGEARGVAVQAAVGVDDADDDLVARHV